MASLGAGKKTKEWWKAKKKLIEIYIKKQITKCENCGSKWALSFHHRPKRSSQNAVHDFKHTRLICGKCHDFFEDNDEKDKLLFSLPRGYNPKHKIKTMANKKTKKAKWELEHKCVNCKEKISSYICHHCKEVSVKK
jgi:hypothetical protein